jgi:hypothetical protein
MVEGTESRENRQNSKNLGIDTKDLGRNFAEIERVVEDYTSKIRPEDFVAMAFGSMAISALFRLIGKNDDAMFVGQWAPSLLALAIFNQIRRRKKNDSYTH